MWEKKEAHIHWLMELPECTAPVTSATLRANGLVPTNSRQNAIGTQIRDPINSVLTLSNVMNDVVYDDVYDDGG